MMKNIIDMDFSKIEKRLIDSVKNNVAIDIHKERASLHLKIPIDEITDDQRSMGKRLNFMGMYGENKGTITGRYVKGPRFQRISRKRSLHELLSPMQVKVSECVGDGLTNKQIAKELGLSPRTVGRHLYMIYKRLGIISRYRLIVIVLTQRLMYDKSF